MADNRTKFAETGQHSYISIYMDKIMKKKIKRLENSHEVGQSNGCNDQFKTVFRSRLNFGHRLEQNEV